MLPKQRIIRYVLLQELTENALFSFNAKDRSDHRQRCNLQRIRQHTIVHEKGKKCTVARSNGGFSLSLGIQIPVRIGDNRQSIEA